MTPYYEGTSEAEHLIRGTPELVGAWLKKAKHDRSKLATRLFQPQKKEFLAGFINGLERHLAAVASTTARKAVVPDPTDYTPAPSSEDSPASADLVIEIVESRDPADWMTPTPAAAIRAPSIAHEPVAEPVNQEDEVVHPPAVVAPVVEAATSLGSHDEPTAEREWNDHTDSAGDPPDTDFEAELALGVMRISGWAVEPNLAPSGMGDRGDPALNSLADASVQTGGPVNSIVWNRVFEQARGVGMVDLSAYDVIDGLGELRELIDRWQLLHQD